MVFISLIALYMTGSKTSSYHVYLNGNKGIWILNHCHFINIILSKKVNNKQTQNPSANVHAAGKNPHFSWSESRHQRASVLSSCCLAGTSSWAAGSYWSPGGGATKGRQINIWLHNHALRRTLHTNTWTNKQTGTGTRTRVRTPVKLTLQTKHSASLTRKIHKHWWTKPQSTRRQQAWRWLWPNQLCVGALWA